MTTDLASVDAEHQVCLQRYDAMLSEIIDFVISKYGNNQTAQLLCIARAAIRADQAKSLINSTL